MAWTAPRTWVAGEVIGASTMNTHVRDNLKALTDARSSYTPSLLAPWLLGNGTLTGRAMVANKLVLASFVLTLGSTTSGGGGALAIELPAVPQAASSSALGLAYLFDTSAADLEYRIVTYSGTSGGVPYARFRDKDGTSVTDTVPWTWAAGDQLRVDNLCYEAA